MDAIKLLKQQHDNVDDLLGKIEKAQDLDRKQSLFEDMADQLAAHAAIEETIFYPAVKDAGKQVHDLVMESVEEHLAIKRVLADLVELDVSDESFDAKLKVLQEEVEHHAREEEEKELFPRVKKAIEADELERMGAEMLALFEKLLSGEPRLAVADQTDHASPV